jgi:serine/threonine protein kinase
MRMTSQCIKEDQLDLEQLRQEVDTHYELSKDPHSHIAQLFGCFYEKVCADGISCHRLQAHTCGLCPLQPAYYIVMEYVAGGNLHDYRSTLPNRCMEEDEAARYQMRFVCVIATCMPRYKLAALCAGTCWLCPTRCCSATSEG